MRVVLKNDYPPHKAGQEVELPEEKARMLIGVGSAEKSKNQADRVRLRFRRETSLEGRNITAGTVDWFEPTKDVWDAVNRGNADLDPPPGGRLGDFTQPFPPEWVGRDATSEAPVPPPQTVVFAQPATTANLTGGRTAPATSEPKPPPRGSEPTPPAGGNPMTDAPDQQSRPRRP